MKAAGLELNLHMRNAREMGLERVKESGSDDQFLFSRDASLHPLTKLIPSQFRRGLMHFNGSMKRFEQRQASHIPDENLASRRDRLDSALQHADQVADVWKILRD